MYPIVWIQVFYAAVVLLLNKLMYSVNQIDRNV